MDPTQAKATSAMSLMERVSNLELQAARRDAENEQTISELRYRVHHLEQQVGTAAEGIAQSPLSIQPQASIPQFAR